MSYVRAYYGKVKSWVSGHAYLSGGISAAGLALFYYLAIMGAVQITSMDGNVTCAGNECWIEVSFTALKDAYIYPNESWLDTGNPDVTIIMKRKWGDSWRTIDLNRTWSKNVKYAVKFSFGQSYTVRYYIYGKKPWQDIEFKFFDRCPWLLGIGERNDYFRITKEETYIDRGVAEGLVCNPTGADLSAAYVSMKNHIYHGNEFVTGYSIEFARNITKETVVYEERSIPGTRIAPNGTIEAYDDIVKTESKAKVTSEEWSPEKPDIRKGECLKARITVRMRPMLGNRSVEYVPELFGERFEEYGWFSLSYTYKRPVYMKCTSCGATLTNLTYLANDSAVYFGATPQRIWLNALGNSSYRIVHWAYYNDETDYVFTDSAEASAAPFDVDSGNRSGVSGVWPMGDPKNYINVFHFTNTSLSDSADSARSAVIVGTATINASSKIGNGTQTDAVGEAVNTSFSFMAELSGGDNFTMSLWFKHNDTGCETWETLFGDWHAAAAGCDDNCIALSAGAIQCLMYGSIQTTSASTYCDANWHHVICSAENQSQTRVSLYIDGVNRTATVANGAIQDRKLGSRISARESHATQRYSGYVDELHLEKRMLSEAEKIFMYNNTVGGQNMSWLGGAVTYGGGNPALKINGTTNDVTIEIGDTANISSVMTGYPCISLNLTGYSNVACGNDYAEYMFQARAAADLVRIINFSGFERGYNLGEPMSDWDGWNGSNFDVGDGPEFPNVYVYSSATWASQGSRSMFMYNYIGAWMPYITRQMDLTTVQGILFDAHHLKNVGYGTGAGCPYSQTSVLAFVSNTTPYYNFYTSKKYQLPYSGLSNTEATVSNIFIPLGNYSGNWNVTIAMYDTLSPCILFIDNLRFVSNDTLTTSLNITSNATVEFGENRSFTNLTFKMSGGFNGNYTTNLTLDIDNDGLADMIYPGAFMGEIFYINDTDEGLRIFNLTFTYPGTQTFGILLPANVTVSVANMTIRGYGNLYGTSYMKDFNGDGADSTDRFFGYYKKANVGVCGSSTDTPSYYAAEFPDSSYASAWSADGTYTSKVYTGISNVHCIYHYFRFAVPEESSRINNLTVVWQGYPHNPTSESETASLVAWNYSSNSWVSLSSGTWASEASSNLTGTTSAKSSFISGGEMQFAVRFDTLGGYSSSNWGLYTDYMNATLNINVSYPSNVSVDFDQDGTEEFSMTGELIAPNITDLNATIINSEIAAIAGRYKEFAVAITSDSSGIVEVRAINFTYNLTQQNGFTGVNATDSRGYMSIRMATAGQINISNIIMEFNGDVDYNVTSGSNWSLLRVKWSNYSTMYPHPWMVAPIFYPSNSTFYNLTPFGQTDSVPSYNITDMRSFNITVGIALNQTLPSCLALAVSNTSSPLRRVNLTTTVKPFYVNLSGNMGLWLFLDGYNCTGGLYRADPYFKVVCDTCLRSW